MKLALSGLVASAFLAAAVPVSAQNIEDVIGGVAQTLLSQEMDKRAYATAQSRNTAQAYRDYLGQFPNGTYRQAALNAIERLGGTVATPIPAPQPDQPNVVTPAATEARLGLSRSQRTAIQQGLTAQGYNTGGADGLWGSRTRSALRNWQSAQGYSATGYLTQEQFSKLYTGAATQAPAPQSAQLEESLLGLTKAERRDGQRRLTHLGYNTRGADGAWGANTRTALRAWQRDQGDTVTGYVTADQWRELRVQAGF